MAGKRVSVIVPVFNAEHCLADTIRSVLAQTYREFELILIDDGSSDRSPEICEQLMQTDERIRFCRQPNAGVSAARNRGIALSSGDYLCFLDADDLLLPDFLDRMIEKAEETDAAAVFGGFRLLYGERTVDRAARLPEGLYETSALKGRAIDDGTLSGILFGSVCAAVYRARTVKTEGLRFEPDIRKNEDGIFNLCLLQRAARVYVIAYDGYLYRQRKSAVRAKTLRRETGLDDASAFIARSFADFPDYALQMRRRTASVTFWNLLGVKELNVPVRDAAKEIEPFLTEAFFDGVNALDRRNLGSYKAILIGCLCRRRTLAFAVLVMKAMPLLENRLRH